VAQDTKNIRIVGVHHFEFRNAPAIAYKIAIKSVKVGGRASGTSSHVELDRPECHDPSIREDRGAVELHRYRIGAAWIWNKCQVFTELLLVSPVAAPTPTCAEPHH
jgi:hypothetical protein